MLSNTIQYTIHSQITYKTHTHTHTGVQYIHTRCNITMNAIQNCNHKHPATMYRLDDLFRILSQIINWTPPPSPFPLPHPLTVTSVPISQIPPPTPSPSPLFRCVFSGLRLTFPMPGPNSPKGLIIFVEDTNPCRKHTLQWTAGPWRAPSCKKRSDLSSVDKKGIIQPPWSVCAAHC